MKSAHRGRPLKSGLARGRPHRQGTLRVTIIMDEGQFGRVREYAEYDRISVSAAVRELVEYGFMSLGRTEKRDF